MPAQSSFSQLVMRCSLFTAISVMAGCSLPPAAVDSPRHHGDDILSPSGPPVSIPVVRYGRYTLVEMSPTTAQHDLMLQIIDVTVPENMPATVGDGLRHTLKRSGFELCDSPAPSTLLYPLPLPAAHLHLGPMTLRDALQTLGGPSWNLLVDDQKRQICFSQIAEHTPPLQQVTHQISESGHE